MNSDAIELSVVLPAYQEADNLNRLLPALHEVIRSLADRYEIIVIDTEKPMDDTPNICATHKATYVLRHGGSRYGDAIRTAQKTACGKYVICMDADGSHNPRFLPELWAQRELTDLIIASRYVHGGKTENPVILIFMSLMVNIVFRIVLGLNCYDVSNSFRLYRGDDFRRLKLECDNFDIVEEILIKLNWSRPKFRILEIPATFEKRQAGTTKRKLLVFAVGYLATLLHLTRLKRQMRNREKRVPS